MLTVRGLIRAVNTLLEPDTPASKELQEKQL